MLGANAVPTALSAAGHITADGAGFNLKAKRPPGTDNIDTLMQYGVWIGLALLTASFIWGIVKIGASIRHGEEVEGVKRTVLSAVCMTLLGSLGAVMGAFS